MWIKKKPTAWGLFVLWAVWTFIGQPIWNLNVERVAERNRIDGTLAEFAPMTWAREIAAYLPSSFAAGFVVGALIFAYWDNLITLLRRRMGKEPAADLRTWIGQIVPYFLVEKSRLELWIYVIVVGDVPLRIRRISGGITIKTRYEDYELREPYFVQRADEYAKRGDVFTIAVGFSTPSQMWDSYPSMFGWHPPTSIDLNNLELVLATEGGVEKKVRMWDSMRLTAGDDHVRAVETIPTFKSKAEKEGFQKALSDAVRGFGVQS